MSILDILKKMVDDEDATELIGSVTPAGMASEVSLEAAGQNLVVDCRIGDDWQFEPPEPTAFERWENPGRWALVYPKQGDFQIVDEDSLKIMRARFLLLNGWYYQHFHALAHSTQLKVMERFIRHTFRTVPAADSAMARLLGMAGAVPEKGGA